MNAAMLHAKTYRAMNDELIDVKRVLIVANPKAGGFSPDLLAAIAAALESNAVHVETRHSESKGDVTTIVSAEANAFDVIAIHGGDGSLNEAVAGLRQSAGPCPALAIIPGGTANVLAFDTSAHFTAPEIAAAIIRGQTMPLHYGLANGHPFVLMASAGLDAAIVHATSANLKTRIGKAAYMAAAVAQLWRAKLPALSVTSGGQSLACRMVICANTSRYGGDFVIAPQTSAAQSGLQLVLVEDDSLIGLLRIVWRILRGHGLEGEGITSLRADEAEIGSASPVPAQIDGDPFGTLPLRIAIAPTALRLIEGP